MDDAAGTGQDGEASWALMEEHAVKTQAAHDREAEEMAEAAE